MKSKHAASHNKKKALLEHRLEAVYHYKHKLAHKIDKAKQAYLEGKISKAQYIKHVKHPAYNKHLEHYDKKIKDYKRHLYSYNKKSDPQLWLLMLVIGILGFAALAGSFGPGLISGQATGVKSEAVIQQYFAIALSDNLVDGIEFGSVLFNTVDNNATDNYNGAGSNTTLYIILSNDSNVNVDHCLKANANLINGSDSIGAGNMTWSSDNTTSSTLPAGPGGSTPFTLNFADSEQNTTPGDGAYYRFWLDIPDDQPGGTYNNTIEFQGVKTGLTCA